MKPENIFSALSALRQEGRLRQVQDLRMETASLGVDREGKRYIVCLLYTSDAADEL